jgi:ADP-ribose pyrophosphatase YjhB (NUDIX family)
VGAVVLGQGGCVALVRRGRAPGRGTWTLPGGKVEPGETHAEAVRREVHEEMGILIGSAVPLGVVPVTAEGFSYSIHEHLCAPEDPDATLRPGDDAVEARWVPPAELETMDLSADVRRVIALGVARARELKW